MELSANNDGTWSIRRMHDLEKLMLEKIAEAADIAGSPEARSRLYPSPIRAEDAVDEADQSISSDWKELVQPELEDGFRSAIRLVENDLKGIKMKGAGKSKSFEIFVPKAHANAWCSALNQARLALHEKFGLPDPDEALEGDPGEGKWMAMLQSEIYGVIMEFLVTRVLWLK